MNAIRIMDIMSKTLGVVVVLLLIANVVNIASKALL